MSVKWLGGFAGAAIALMMVSGDARASACCGESHGLGERLGSSERAALTASVRLRERYGSWAASGDYAATPAGDYERELRTDLGWLVRTGPLQLGASLPVLGTFKSLGGLSSSGGGIGDVAAVARWDVLPVTGWRSLPGIALTLGVTMPTGRGAAESDDVVAADATGLGAAEMRPGLALEKTWDSGWYAMGLASIGLRVPAWADGRQVALAPRGLLAAMGGHTFSSGTSVGLGALFEAEGAPSVDGREATDASRRRTAILLFGAHDLSARWTVLGSLVADLPVDQLGKNESPAIAGSIGVRFAWQR